LNVVRDADHTIKRIKSAECLDIRTTNTGVDKPPFAKPGVDLIEEILFTPGGHQR
jgi:hypothetical protein